ncbi:hypothetical protein V8E53_010989 [Lactarius tabidus]
MLAPANSELPWGDGWVTSGLRAVFHKGKVVVRGREGMDTMFLHAVEQAAAMWFISDPSLSLAHARGPGAKFRSDFKPCLKLFTTLRHYFSRHKYIPCTSGRGSALPALQAYAFAYTRLQTAGQPEPSLYLQLQYEYQFPPTPAYRGAGTTSLRI